MENHINTLNPRVFSRGVHVTDLLYVLSEIKEIVKSQRETTGNKVVPDTDWYFSYMFKEKNVCENLDYLIAQMGFDGKAKVTFSIERV